MKRHIFGGICQVLFRKKWGDFNYEQRKSLEKSRLRIPRRYFTERGVCVIADIVKTRQEKTNNKRGIGNRGKTKIVVKEHFSEKGKTMEELLTDVMLEKAKQTIA